MKHTERILIKSRPRTTTPPQFDFSGHWVNELQSFMELKITGSSVSGTYTSSVSSSGGPVSAPLVGSVVDDLISFTVNWGVAITAWVGHGIYDANKNPQILTLWQMVMAVEEETDPQNQWKTVEAGADTFTR